MVRRLLFAGLLLAAVVAVAVAAQRGGCPLTQGAKAAAPATAQKVQAKTPEQKAYLAEAATLRAQVTQNRTELAALQAKEKPSAEAIKAKQAELDAARKKLHAYNVKSKDIRLALGLKDCSTCPKAGECDGTECAHCADCPKAGECDGTACAQHADCPKAGACDGTECAHHAGCATGASAKGGCAMSGAAHGEGTCSTSHSAAGHGGCPSMSGSAPAAGVAPTTKSKPAAGGCPMSGSAPAAGAAPTTGSKPAAAGCPMHAGGDAKH